MGNATAAKEWLSFAHKDLEEAILLDQNDFYTDKIGFSLQQASDVSKHYWLMRIKRLRKYMI